MAARQGRAGVMTATSVAAPARAVGGTVARGLSLLGDRSRYRRQPLVVALLVASDFLLAFAVWQAAFLAQSVWGYYPLSGGVAFASLLPNVAAWIGLRALLGLYPGYGLGAVEELRRQTFGSLVTLAITTTFAFASQAGDSLSRLLLFAWIFGLLVAAPFARNLTRWVMNRGGVWGKPVVVFGAEQPGMRVIKVLRDEWQFGLNPVGVFDNRAPATESLEGVPYRGNLADAASLAGEHGLDTAIFAMPHTRREHLARFTSLASASFRHIVVIPNLGGITNSAVVARDLGGTFGVEIKHNLLNPWAQRAKRAMDLAATLAGALFAVPVILVLAALVRLESRGPVFYKDFRMGRDGRLFPCIKFRTMVPDAEALLQRVLEEDAEKREEYLLYHKLKDDPRVTRVGRLLRKTSLDELPQLWNVVRGEMSLVGPRPYLPRESKDIGQTQGEILRVTPGITGPWQVAGRSNTSFLERVGMDAHYVHDWSVWLDVILLARTAKSLISNRDAC